MIRQSVLNTIALFRKEGRQNSSTFAYWDTFLKSGSTLLLLLRTEREPNFPMHIQAVIEMVPYFILAWACQLCSIHPSVYSSDRAVRTSQATNVPAHDEWRICCAQVI